MEEPAHPDAGSHFLRDCGDPVMAGLVERIGPLDHEARRRGRPDDAYGSLVRTIVGQQLSTSAARTIYARLTALFGGRADPGRARRRRRAHAARGRALAAEDQVPP